jgi:multidrug efflux system membrane fusion protein
MGTKLPTTVEPHSPEDLHPPRTNDGTFNNVDLEGGPHGKNHWWVWLLIFAAIGYGCYRLWTFENGKKATMSTFQAASMKPRSVPVVAATARREDMPVYLEGLGTVTAFNTVTVKSRIDGPLINVTFKEGQTVHKGDLLAEIDPRPYQVALDQAKGNLAQAKGALERDQAGLRDAELNYQRDKDLFKDNIIAKQQMDTQLATADQDRGSIASDQATIAADQAAIEAAELNLTYTKITAPISGQIGLRLVDAGNMVHAADTTGIALITQLQPISVLFSLPEDQLPEVLRRLHSGAKMRVDAYDRDQRHKLAEGTLLTVDNQIDQTTGTSKLKAVFPNTDHALFPNQFVNARLWLNTQKNVIVIPSVAIQRGPAESFVYLVQPDNTVVVRDVKVGMTQGNDVAIDDGLKTGDRVVVDGAERLTEGMKVSATEASASR